MMPPRFSELPGQHEDIFVYYIVFFTFVEPYLSIFCERIMLFLFNINTLQSNSVAKL